MMTLTRIEQDIIDLEETISDLQGLMKNCYFDSAIGTPHEFIKTIIEYAENTKSNAQHLIDTYSEDEIQKSLNS